MAERSHHGAVQQRHLLDADAGGNFKAGHKVQKVQTDPRGYFDSRSGSFQLGHDDQLLLVHLSK